MLVQNLMEKINYLQRRVVFLENELADAAASHSEEEGGGEYDDHRFNRGLPRSQTRLGGVDSKHGSDIQLDNIPY